MIKAGYFVVRVALNQTVATAQSTVLHFDERTDWSTIHAGYLTMSTRVAWTCVDGTLCDQQKLPS